MSSFLHHFILASPLFLLVLAGYAVVRLARWPTTVSEALLRFAYAIAIPAMLFCMMSDFSRMPPVDARLLLAFFGGCLIVFVIGRLVAHALFRLDGVAQSVFALGMGLAENRIRDSLNQSLAICAIKLGVQPLVVWLLARPRPAAARNASGDDARLAGDRRQCLHDGNAIRQHARSGRRRPCALRPAVVGHYAIGADADGGGLAAISGSSLRVDVGQLRT